MRWRSRLGKQQTTSNSLNRRKPRRDFTETRYVKEDADGTCHSVTVTEETVAPEGLDEYGKRVTVSQSIMLGGTFDGYSQYPDAVIVRPENSWDTYAAATFELLEKLDDFEFDTETPVTTRIIRQ
jgi:hypothetical protein